MSEPFNTLCQFGTNTSGIHQHTAVNILVYMKGSLDPTLTLEGHDLTLSGWLILTGLSIGRTEGQPPDHFLFLPNWLSCGILHNNQHLIYLQPKLIKLCLLMSHKILAGGVLYWRILAMKHVFPSYLPTTSDVVILHRIPVTTNILKTSMGSTISFASVFKRTTFPYFKSPRLSKPLKESIMGVTSNN